MQDTLAARSPARPCELGYDVVISNSRGPETLADLVAELGPQARAATRGRGGRGRRLRRRHRPAEEHPGHPGGAAGGQDRARHEQLLLGARRAVPGTGHRRGHHLRAAAGAPAQIQGGQGLQPHHVHRDHHRRDAGRHAKTAARWPRRATSRRRPSSSPGSTTSSASTPSTSARSPKAGAWNGTARPTSSAKTRPSCRRTSRRLPAPSKGRAGAPYRPAEVTARGSIRAAHCREVPPRAHLPAAGLCRVSDDGGTARRRQLTGAGASRTCATRAARVPARAVQQRRRLPWRAGRARRPPRRRRRGSW